MRPDIRNIDDIKILVDSFYSKVLQNDVLKHIFNNPDYFNLQTHLPVMYSFWETVLFSNASYKGNPIATHIELDKKESLHEIHFATWLQIWFATIDENFEGNIANDAKKKAEQMKLLMMFKIDASRNKGFIQ